MLETRNHCMQSYSTNDGIDVIDSCDSYVFKKIINAAIYVEKTVKKMAPDLQNYERHLAETIKIMKTKRCSCYIDAESCPCHPTMSSGDGLKGTRSQTKIDCKESEFLQNMEKLKNINDNIKRTLINRPMKTRVSKEVHPRIQNNPKPFYKLHLSKIVDANLPKVTPSENKPVYGNEINSIVPGKIPDNVSDVKENFPFEIEPKTQLNKNVQESDNESNSSTSSSTTSACSQITVKRSDKVFMCDSKISLSSLTSFTPSESNSVRKWLTKKLEEQKKKELAQREEERKKQLKREKILEKERENFRMWLAAKKREEDKKRAEIERQQQLDHLRELQQQKRNLENQINYQIWLKRKERADIEQKNQIRLRHCQAKIEQDLKKIANQKAFEEWLQFSKNKPKPLAPNNGLDSLRSSMSVTYVNPVPWVANIDFKPASQ